MTNMELLKINATEIEQHGKKMYVFIIDAKTLYNICTVSRREENKLAGYQRNLREGRARTIATYVDKQSGLIPNNLIINFDDTVKYENGQLIIPMKPDIAWVIDGQHRLYGLHLAEANPLVSVLAFKGLSLDEQAALFVKINSTQKGVPTSLILDLLPMTENEESLERKVRDLVSRLNSEEDSPWYNNVNMTGEGKGDISLVNFHRKLKPLLDPQRGTLRMYTFEEQYKILFNYFTAIKTVFLDQWSNKNRKLTKTLGFGALMNAFPDIFALTLRIHSKFTKTAVIQVFKLIGDLQFDSETLGRGSGSAAEDYAGNVIIGRITAIVRKAQPKTELIPLDD